MKRRSPEWPAIVAFLPTLVPKVEGSIAAYDNAAKYQAHWKKEMAEGRGAIGTLLKAVQARVPLLKRDIPGFDGSVFGDHPEVPDVIEDGDRMASVIEEYRDPSGNPLAYQKAALAELSPAVNAAMKEWGEDKAADSKFQQTYAAVRAMADPLQDDLVALRRTLGAKAGQGLGRPGARALGMPTGPDDTDLSKIPVPGIASPCGVTTVW